MRMVIFWLKLLIFIPGLYLDAKKAKKMPFEQRYAFLREKVIFITKLMNIPIETIGTNNIPLENGFLFVGNHQGTADMFVLIASNPVPTTAVSKSEGKKIPLLYDWYDAMEVVFFNRESLKDAVRMNKEVIENLKSKRNVTIFPEGTRSQSQQMNPFKPGSLKSAVTVHAPIVPFALVNSYIPFNSKEKIKTIKVVFLEPIHYEEYQKYSTQELADEIQKRIQNTINQYQ